MHIRSSMISLAFPGVFTAALCGCASHEIALPAGAEVVRAGSGRLDYAAVENGKVYLFDSSTKKAVFFKPMMRGDRIIVDPSHDKIVVVGEAADHAPPLNPEHSYGLYFDRAQ